MNIVLRRPLYIQIVFTIIAFAAMVFFGYFFMRDIVHKNLVSRAESVFKFARTNLESDLLEPRTMLSGFSQTARNMIIRGESADGLLNYMDDIGLYFRSGGSHIMSSVVIFGYFEAFGSEPLFLSTFSEWPDDYNAPNRLWFKMAVDNCGVVIETPPYESILTRNTVITYARCIHDDDDVRLGIVGMEIKIDDIGRNIVDIAMESGGYSMVVSQELTIIAHANPEFAGRHVSDPSVPIHVFAEEMAAGHDIVEKTLTNWAGETSVVFLRRLVNGWYLGLSTPEGPFYQSLTSMATIFIILGLIFSGVLITILISIDAARTKSDMESRHKSAFLANMSHEIRTPMNAIIGMTAIGKSSSEVERKDHCFAKIEDASNHLLGVINDILDMSKIEANKFDLSPVDFNFEKLLQRIVSVVNFRIDEKHHRLNVYIDKKIPKNLLGDDQRLAQIITNLLGNAIKFTPNYGTITLETSFVVETDGLCTIQISISDTGIGMNHEQQNRVFSSFEQAETTTTRKYGGTGLGLAISKNIVEMMGGNIWMVSESGKGSTFTFTVKMKRGKESQQRILSPDVNLQNVRLMVVDDDRDILEYFCEISSEFDLYCDTATSGAEAIDLVEKNGHYHIYFIDWKMPGMDGIQLTAELKAHQEPVNSVVIMITAAEWTAVETEARSAGVDKFLSKPLFPSSIANIINEALGIDQKKIDDVCNTENILDSFLGRRILLVEDVEINREIVMTLLEPTGMIIECAENGKEAVRMFSEAPDRYDMIFMDVQMPEMDGYEATRRIRAMKQPQAQTIRIIAMTANVFREDIERCLEAGMDNHIGKPINFEEILEKLNIYMPKRRG